MRYLVRWVGGAGQVGAFVFALSCLTAGAAWAQAPIRVRTAAELQGAFSRVPDGGVIELAAGTYRAPANGFNVSNLRKEFTVRAAAGVPTSAVVLDGEGARPILRLRNRSRAQGKAITFQGLTFANGVSTANNDAGGVSVAFGEARFIRCFFRGNRADGPSTGGGALKIYDGSTVSVIGGELRDNSSKNRGGAISMRHSELYVHDALFAGNRVNLPGHSSRAAGGAVYVLDGKLRVFNTRFEGNQAGWVGGAVYAFGTWSEPVGTPRADVTIVRSTFTDNRAVADPCCAPAAETTGGAIHAEDHATLRIQGSYFLRNQAEFGGAVDLYRAVAEIGGSIFQGNQANVSPGRIGAGGALAAFSNDGLDSPLDRRPARVDISDTFLQGRLGPGPAPAHLGGCLMVAGDKNRHYGENGTVRGGTAAENRAVLTLRNVLLADCDVEVGPAGAGGFGGAVQGELVDLLMEDSLILNSDAAGAGDRGGVGGGISLQYDANAVIRRSALARNSAARWGGGLFVSGSAIRVEQSQFLGNDVVPGTSERLADSRGASLFTIPLASEQNPLRAHDVSGVVASSVFSDDLGLPIWEVDPGVGPANAVRYDGNRIFGALFGDRVYLNTFTDPGRRGSNVPELNSLFVSRPGRPATRKSEVPNERLFSPPSAGTVVAVPSGLAAGAPGATARARIGFAWAGRSAALAGQPLDTRAGLLTAPTPGDYALAVDGAAADLARVGPLACTGGPVLCLQNGRFRVEAQWKDAAGNTSAARAVAISEQAGWFGFADPASVELAVRILPGNGYFGVSFAGLSTLEAAVTVLDTVTGRVKTYAIPAGTLASVADPRAFPASAAAAARSVEGDLVAVPEPACAVGPGQLCLSGGRIRAELTWRNPRTGRVQAAQAVPLADGSGYFWLNAAGAPDLVIKIVDGRALNRHFWVFYGALTSEQFTLTVVDTDTGRRKVYNNPAGRLMSRADTMALRE